MNVRAAPLLVTLTVATSCWIPLTQAGDAGGQVSTASSETVVKTPGWRAIPHTELSSVCPDVAQIQGVEGCSAVIADWNGALADTKRNRLILWGGGHSGYFGNEVYALDVEHSTLERI